MEINEAVKKVHGLALEQGWWIDHEEDRNLSAEARLAKHMLFVTEVAEASEAVREKKPHFYIMKTMMTDIIDPGKPEGEAIELADVVIRIMDYFGFMGWDLDEMIRRKHEYNLTRALRHGGKAI